MIAFLSAYESLIDIAILNIVMAFSQYIVLRAGVFSLANAGLTSLGAYTAAVLALRLGAPPILGLFAATAMGTLAAGVLSLPLARLRGFFQAIATVAFVEIVLSLTLYFGGLTGGALGMNAIPKVVTTWQLLLILAAILYLLNALKSFSIGRAFDAIREDEVVAVSLGISVARYQALAFLVSGAIAGLAGGLLAYDTYSISPDQFGFGMLALVLAAVVLGGRSSVFGPVVGALIFTLLPELARPLAEQRFLLQGIFLMVVITYLPEGIVDTLALRWRQWRAQRRLRISGGDMGNDLPVAR